MCILLLRFYRDTQTHTHMPCVHRQHMAWSQRCAFVAHQIGNLRNTRGYLLVILGSVVLQLSAPGHICVHLQFFCTNEKEPSKLLNVIFFKAKSLG